MLEIGKTQTLKVIKKVDFGVYLAEDTDDAKNGRDGEVEKVLLPKSQVRQEIIHRPCSFMRSRNLPWLR